MWLEQKASEAKEKQCGSIKKGFKKVQCNLSAIQEINEKYSERKIWSKKYFKASFQHLEFEELEALS